MIWPLRLPRVAPLLVSALLTVISVARAEPANKSDIYISHFSLQRNWPETSSDKQLLEILKHRLREHGYETAVCKESEEAWDEIIDQLYEPVPYEEIEQSLMESKPCALPKPGTSIYSARLTLDYDPELHKRQATLYLLPLQGGGRKREGTYTHKDGAIESWYTVIDRVIEHAIQGTDGPVSIRIRLPKEAAVSDVVTMDGTSTWDPDGDAFELLWKVTVKACVGNGTALPRNGHACPEGTKLADLPVRDRAGDNVQIREFSVPMVGDYHIRVHAKLGAREEADRHFTVRAEPRRQWTLYTRQGITRLPTYFLTDREGSHIALFNSIGLQKRFIHRTSWHGWHEEVHYGLSVTSLKDLKSVAGAIGLSLDVVGRTLDRTGRYGLLSLGSIGVLGIGGDRRFETDHDEWGMFYTGFMGGYYAFGENYRFQRTKFCSNVCPSIALGPTVAVLHNATQKRVGISLGVETLIGIEF